MASIATTETPTAAFPPIEMEDAACPSGCERDDELVLRGRDRLHDLPGEFAVVRCRRCGLMRTNPRPTPQSVGHYYPADYSPYLDSVAGRPKRARRQTWHRRLRKRVQKFFRLQDPRDLPMEPPGRMLEIGCASGAYLARAAADGWTVSGIEFSDTAAQRARESGFDVRSAAIEDVPAPAEKYDLVAGWMVFEHVHRPQDVFRLVREWVRDDGWLVMSVPDAGALEFRLFGPRWYALHLPGHMTHFTPKSLRRLLGDSGWTVEHIFWPQNPNNLFQSLRYWALDKGHLRLARFLLDVIRRKRLRRLHRWIGRLLGLTRQSGRMVVWARRSHS